MIYYNYRNLFLAAQGSPKLIVTYFLNANFFEGQSFILGVAPIKDAKLSYIHRAEYLALLSYRNKTDFLLSDIVHLNVAQLPPHINKQQLLNNPLIQLKDNLVIFPLEERINNRRI